MIISRSVPVYEKESIPISVWKYVTYHRARMLTLMLVYLASTVLFILSPQALAILLTARKVALGGFPR